MADETKKPLGRILLQQRSITEQELTSALDKSRTSGQPLATQLTEQGAISEIEALKALSEQSGVPGIDLSQVCIRLSELSVLPREVALRHRLLPVLARDDRLFVAMAAPTDKKVIDEIEFVTGKRVFAYIALSGPLLKATNAAYSLKDRGETHYAGPNCPPEVLRKAGLTPRDDGPARAAMAEPTPRPLPAPAPTAAPLATRQPPQPQPQPLIVDDTMGRMAVADELTDADFGNASRDLSVVGHLPVGAPASAGQRTILIVDDEPDIRKLLRRVLEARGHRVLEADRGLLALRIVKEQPLDLIILDAMLPEVHGFDIARRIKGSERYGHIPIVMISAVYRGWRFAEDVKTSYGVDAYIEKPFKVSDAIAAIESALSRGATPQDTEQVSADAEQYLALGIQAYQAGNIDQAIEHLRRGTRIDPLAYRLHFHLGLLYGKKDQNYEAIQELETALQMNGSHFPALKNLAVLYQKTGLRNKAVETWERALRVAPDDATKQSIKEHLLGLL
jgi:DNA-binding response OmpR family regulator